MSIFFSEASFFVQHFFPVSRWLQNKCTCTRSMLRSTLLFLLTLGNQLYWFASRPHGWVGTVAHTAKNKVSLHPVVGGGQSDPRHAAIAAEVRTGVGVVCVATQVRCDQGVDWPSRSTHVQREGHWVLLGTKAAQIACTDSSWDGIR